MIDSGKDISPQSLRTSHPSLRKAVQRKFNNWDGLYREIGIDPSNVRQRFYWSASDITTKIKMYHSNGTSVNSVNIKTIDASLYNAARRCFGDWKTAVESSGIDYLGLIDHTLITGCGFLFEQILKEIFEALDYKFQYNKPISTNCRPDFLLDDGTIIDAKLSSWSAFLATCETIDKYLQHTDKLIIVYLRGKEIKREVQGVTFVNVKEYYPLLVELGRIDLIRRCKERLDEVTEAHSMCD